jgi:hypothetical protein
LERKVVSNLKTKSKVEICLEGAFEKEMELSAAIAVMGHRMPKVPTCSNEVDMFKIRTRFKMFAILQRVYAGVLATSTRACSVKLLTRMICPIFYGIFRILFLIHL